MTDPITPTQADRDAAAYYRAATDYGSNDPSGDLLVIAIARVRIAAEERGARWGIEAAAEWFSDRFSDAVQADTENGVKWLNERAADAYLKDAPDTLAAIREGEEAISALDPKTICDSARETDDAA